MRVYYTRIDSINDETMECAAAEWLPAYRLDKIRHRQQAHSRRESMAAGLLLEYALREMGLSSKTLTPYTNADGKPYFKELPDLYYNLSHSGDYAALALGPTEVGIDIEKIREGKERLAKRFFAKEEYEQLQGEWSDEEFTRIWTRKESVIKACGVGMRMPLADFSTSEQQVAFGVSCRVLIEGMEEAYFVESYRIHPEYWLSVCCNGQIVKALPQEVNIRDLVRK